MDVGGGDSFPLSRTKIYSNFDYYFANELCNQQTTGGFSVFRMRTSSLAY